MRQNVRATVGGLDGLGGCRLRGVVAAAATVVAALGLVADARLTDGAAWIEPGSRGPGVQPREGPSRADLLKAEQAFVQAFNAGNLTQAEKAAHAWVELAPTEPTPRYNLAVVLARAAAKSPLAGDAGNGAGDAGKQPDEPAPNARERLLTDAAGALREAVRRGFVDFAFMQRDPNLAPLRESRTFRQIISNWRTLQDAWIDDRLDDAKQAYGPGYRIERIESMRLGLVSGFGEQSTAAAREELEQLARWWIDAVLPPGQAATVADGDQPDPWVVVLLPTERDFARWAAESLGTRADRIAGLYEHDRRRLVARDTGPTMRHEFWHVLHWRHMNRLGQTHPLWVQEGLCSLAEDVAIPVGAGSGGGDRVERHVPREERAAASGPAFAPAPSWRTNTARRMAERGLVIPLERFFKLERAEFMGDRSLGNYAQARAFFLFLHQRGQLAAWYRAFTEGFAEDPTGAAATRVVLGADLATVDKDFRAWLKQLPMVAEVGSGTRAVLPMAIDRAVGDGVRLAISLDLRGRREAGDLMPGDIIIAIDGQPVRDEQDLVRVLGPKDVGDAVEVTFRRGAAGPRAKTGSTRVTLVTPMSMSR